MKALRFAWDHPGMTAIVAVLIALNWQIIFAHPLMFGGVAVIAGLSARKAVQQADEISRVQADAARAMLDAQLEQVELLKIEAREPFVVIGDGTSEFVDLRTGQRTEWTKPRSS
jgi:hypothetical protein